MEKILLIFSCLLAIVSDMLLVWWAKEEVNHNWVWILGLVLINIASVIWMYTMRKGIESPVAITFYAVLTVAGCSYLGMVIFNEHISVINGIGIVLGLIALIMISI